MPSSYLPSKPQCSLFIHGKGKSICTCPFHNDDDPPSPTLLSLLPISAHPHTSKLPSATAEDFPLSTSTPSPTQSMLSNPLVQNFMNAFALATVPATAPETVNIAAGQKGKGKEVVDGVKMEKNMVMGYKLDVSGLDNMPPMIIEYITI